MHVPSRFNRLGTVLLLLPGRVTWAIKIKLRMVAFSHS